jgi:hypothetical protein
LVDLAEQPVNLMSGAGRRGVVDEAVELLAQTVRDTSPRGEAGSSSSTTVGGRKMTSDAPHPAF